MFSFSAHNSIPAAFAGRRELDGRTNHGFDVRLWWDPVDDRVSVTVADSRTGLEFEVPVRDAEAPLDVFHHPFAYASDRARALRPAAAPVAGTTAGEAR